MKENIAVDIDDVLLQSTKAFVGFLAKRDIFLEYNDVTSRRFWEVIGCSRESSRKLVLEFLESNIFRSVEMVPGADKAIKKISSRYDLYLVTCRPPTTKAVTSHQINKYFGKIFAKTFFVNQFEKPASEESAKKEIVEDDLQAKFLIEDDPDITRFLDPAKVKVIMFAQPWNKQAVGVRLSNWSSISSYILRNPI